MKISEVIRYYRKNENLTQEQVANYLNISAPAVNKWENGISYPDITLLPPLARVLKIDVNTLLAFNEELTDIEVKKLTKEVGEMASKEGFQKAFEKASDLIKQYPSCDELTFMISTVLRIHLLAPEIEDKDKYERKIIAWLELVAASGKEKTASMAKLDLSAIYRNKKEYEKAQEVLDKIPEVTVDKKIQQAILLESRGKIHEAYGIYETKLRENGHETITVLSLIINQLYKEKKFSEAEEYIERAKKVIEVFDLGAYHKYQLELSLAIEKQDKEKAIEMIINMVNEASSMDDPMKSKLYKHKKFNVTNSWSKDKYESLVKRVLKKRNDIDFVKNDFRIKFLLE
ncbi:helix-turn-helix domain-containing protein [Clostridium saccharobutylicum]|uniref:Transcriptional regulator, XRE family n=1 Tax=Clostridium saccharobutylicum DSM 13864 TaxID=1345695 RepID=U5MY72_CLOSA|nr:helix-turn-helix transcriptional regulator [Clostridium saccharobutylicum]AGX44392.1 transcriptional regulator, XRE family [Clostridium saccharobutylicum DSM 13864]AQR91685.1 transcriptional repressor DicA [Clostridium saccharobutylicum]AQS01589.1 transcriptional repressor DicA [Clostridium saccharobutylicum]AQS15572.1 transcriptional repressor DicA [Clostridium saccharobutylicum]MBA2907289.1 transcriptional regulator with XRE-family HTH domain [Clostridium saccharobutylicum]